jgi:hypothetical protein
MTIQLKKINCDHQQDDNPHCQPAYCNAYHCQHCNVSWEDHWSCACDDECPECGKAITPEDSEIIAACACRALWRIIDAADSRGSRVCAKLDLTHTRSWEHVFMAKKKRRGRPVQSFTIYILEISNWDWAYSFGVNFSTNDDHRYGDYARRHAAGADWTDQQSLPCELTPSFEGQVLSTDPRAVRGSLTEIEQVAAQ